jgi:GNAT superfamily N-acetyltransferase
MTEEEFRETYRGTPVLRAKRRGLARNAAVALGNVGTEADVPVWRRRWAGTTSRWCAGMRLGARPVGRERGAAGRWSGRGGSTRTSGCGPRPRRRWARRGRTRCATTRIPGARSAIRSWHRGWWGAGTSGGRWPTGRAARGRRGARWTHPGFASSRSAAPPPSSSTGSPRPPSPSFGARSTRPPGRRRKRPRRVAADIDAGGAAVAWIGGEVVGAVRWAPRTGHLYVGRLAVLPTHRGQGVGAALVAFAETQAASLGLPEVRVEVRSALPGNAAFFRGRGLPSSRSGPTPACRPRRRSCSRSRCQVVRRVRGGRGRRRTVPASVLRHGSAARLVPFRGWGRWVYAARAAGIAKCRPAVEDRNATLLAGKGDCHAGRA